MAELNGDRVGSWKGFPVFSSHKVGLNTKGNGAFFYETSRSIPILSFKKCSPYLYYLP